MTSEPAAPPFRLPPVGPSSAELADRELWEKTAAASLASVQAAAEKWRTGLAAFVTLVTGGLLIKGPEAAKDLGEGWRALMTVLGGGGLVLAVLGLWQALRAAAGVPAGLRYEDVVSQYGSFRQFEVSAARAAAGTLARARKLVVGSLVLLGLTVMTWWWIPPESSHLVRVVRGEQVLCGTLQSADHQRFVIQVNGTADPTTVSFGEVTNVFFVDEC